MTKRLFIIGSGGHARVIARAAAGRGLEAIFVVRDAAATAREMRGSGATNALVLEEELLRAPPQGNDWGLVCGVGSVGDMRGRRMIVDGYTTLAARFTTLFDTAALVDSSAIVGRGSFIAAGAIVACDARVGEHAIVNTGVIIEHDCAVGTNVHVASGALLAGGALIGDDVLVGCGAVIIQGVTVGANVIVGAGSVVVSDIPANSGTWVGVPARPLGGR